MFLRLHRIAWIAAKREAGSWREWQSIVNNVNKNFQRRASHAGVENITLHDLRRSAITHWSRKLSVPIVKELAGHADVKTTLQYYVSIRAEGMAEARDFTANALLLDPN